MPRKRQCFQFILALTALAITFGLAVRAQAQTVTNLADFNYTNGSRPISAVVEATDGNYYGVTESGGPFAGGYGTLYRMTPSGKLTALYNFCSKPNCSDGEGPFAAPVLGSDGNLYGVTPYGGSDAANSFGSGTVYKMTLGGKITTLYTFCEATPCPDGQYPNGIVLGADESFYGTTLQGGEFNEGEIFSISSTGKLKVLHSFCSSAKCVDGAVPYFPPIQGSDGNFYGTTAQGGTGGVGTVYELTGAGTYKVLHSFCSDSSCQDGWPPTTIVQDANGDFFGMTQTGGATLEGSIFEITSKHQFIVLHGFADSTGGDADVGLTLASDGNLYGTTLSPGTDEGGGTLFEITPAGVFTQLHTFSNCSISGYSPLSPLFQGTDGILYGTTLFGGNDTSGGCSGDGTIFSLSNGLDPLVETVPVAGKVGKQVIILGNGLTGSTSVKFNGKSAAFTVVSDTYIKATVPAGATTGTVSVVTPSGTLDSNPQFVVTK
ncbi:MAG: choice-of-anchor tandem repeat GloVer-containing protein [Candidatus Sulfotelmatobacter sp.]|jgi:uncharacterized repeat protein (TIGR03803 family)